MATAHSSEDEQPSVIEARRAPGRPDSALIYGATVQLLTFDKAEPRAWFRIADANFGIRRVTDPVTKYYYVLSKLDSETLRKLSAFLDRPLGSDPYADIRKKLCKMFEPPLEAKLDAFLATNDTGDVRPAEFGLELQRLLANASIDDLLKRHLPAFAPADDRHGDHEQPLSRFRDCYGGSRPCLDSSLDVPTQPGRQRPQFWQFPGPPPRLLEAADAAAVAVEVAVVVNNLVPRPSKSSRKRRSLPFSPVNSATPP